MSRFAKTSVALTIALLVGAIPVNAADVSPVRQQAQEQVYGSQLMTRQERIEYQARLRNATSAQEREQIRLEHHQAMQERAKAQGMSLPDQPFSSGGGSLRQGGGMGPAGGGRMGGGR